jgi:hypothetical protein
VLEGESMMGTQIAAPRLFYDFYLDDHVPGDSFKNAPKTLSPCRRPNRARWQLDFPLTACCDPRIPTSAQLVHDDNRPTTQHFLELAA